MHTKTAGSHMSQTLVRFAEINQFAHLLVDAVGPSLLIVGVAICGAENDSRLDVGLVIGLTALCMGFFYEQPFFLSSKTGLLRTYAPSLVVSSGPLYSFLRATEPVLSLLFYSSRMFASAFMFLSVFPEHSHVIACVLLSLVGCALTTQYGYSVLLSNLVTVVGLIFFAVHAAVYFPDMQSQISCGFQKTQLTLWFLMSTVVFYMQGSATDMSSIYSNVAKWVCLAPVTVMYAAGYTLPCTVCYQLDNSFLHLSVIVFVGLLGIAGFNLYFQMFVQLVKTQFSQYLHVSYYQDFVHLIYIWSISVTLLAVMLFTFDPEDTFHSSMWVILVVSKIKFLHLLCSLLLG